MPRKNTNLVEDLLELISRLPAWLGVCLALGTFLELGWFVQRPSSLPIFQPADPGDFLLRSMILSAARVGQYVLPIVCLLAAGVSAWHRKQRHELFGSVAQANTVASISRLTWPQFERLVGEAFRNKGFSVRETGSDGADGGIDLVLTKDGEKTLVQCKQWRAHKVGVAIVRELFGLMAAHGAASGYVVTSGAFTQEAQAFAEGRNIHLINGEGLRDLIKHGARETTARELKDEDATDPNPSASTIECPKCGATMVRRLARHGKNAGTWFWGCSTFPICRGIRTQ